jgi:hypothetical protein
VTTEAHAAGFEAVTEDPRHGDAEAADPQDADLTDA